MQQPPVLGISSKACSLSEPTSIDRSPSCALSFSDDPIGTNIFKRKVMSEGSASKAQWLPNVAIATVGLTTAMKSSVEINYSSNTRVSAVLPGCLPPNPFSLPKRNRARRSTSVGAVRAMFKMATSLARFPLPELPWEVTAVGIKPSDAMTRPWATLTQNGEYPLQAVGVYFEPHFCESVKIVH